MGRLFSKSLNLLWKILKNGQIYVKGLSYYLFFRILVKACILDFQADCGSLLVLVWILKKNSGATFEKIHQAFSVGSYEILNT